MVKWYACIFCVLLVKIMIANNSKHVVYLILGQGSDYRLFENIDIDSSFEIKHISYSIPQEQISMSAYARILSEQIDTSHSYSIVGVSLGGMIATEMSDFLNPEKVIIISSAKSRKELPVRYRMQKVLRLYKLIPGKIAKGGAKILQPLIEPDRNKEKETCKRMLEDKHPEFLRRTIAMILEWNRISYSERIIHIHGDNDRTIPIRNVTYNYCISDGSHMMVLTRGKEISEIINTILHDE